MGQRRETRLGVARIREGNIMPRTGARSCYQKEGPDGGGEGRGEEREGGFL